MKRVVLKYGGIAAAIVGIGMAISMPFHDSYSGEMGMVIGYTTMVIAFLMVYFGIRSYRDQEGGGVVSFGRAFQVGIFIVLVGAAGYIATWEVVFNKFMPDFADKYATISIEKAKTSGKTPAEIEATTAQMESFRQNYKKPLIRIAYTFIEIFPVGLLITLVSAGALRRRTPALNGRSMGTASA